MGARAARLGKVIGARIGPLDERKQGHCLLEHRQLGQAAPELGEKLLAMAAKHPDAMRLMFTGYADIRAVVEAINRGNVYRYITKPWDPAELMAIIREACERFDHPAILPVLHRAVLGREHNHRPTVGAVGEDVAAVDLDRPAAHVTDSSRAGRWG